MITAETCGIRLISNSEYFGEYDAKITACIDRSPSVFHAVRDSPTDQEAASRLFRLCGEILALGRGVCGLPAQPRPDGDFDEFFSRVAVFAEVCARSGDEPFKLVVAELSKHVSHCERFLSEANSRSGEQELLDGADRSVGLEMAQRESDFAEVDVRLLSRTSADQQFEAVLSQAGDRIGQELAESLDPSVDEKAARRESEALAIAQCKRDFAISTAVILLKYIFNSFKWVEQDPRDETVFFDPTATLRDMPDSSRRIIEASRTALQGWCSTQKAVLLYSLVREHRPQVTVEIGIYGGQSIVPMAVAARDNRQGHIVGIETWTSTEAKQYRTNIVNDFWWMTVDFKSLKRDFHAFLAAQDLDYLVKVIEARSDRAHYVLDSIDMLHIDGGHSTFGAAQDIINYVAKVKRGGIVVFDDINWRSTGPGLQILLDTCRLLQVVEAEEGTNVPGCAAFIKV